MTSPGIIFGFHVELSVVVGRVDVDVEVDMEVEWVDVVGVNGSGLWLSGFAFFGTEGFFIMKSPGIIFGFH